MAKQRRPAKVLRLNYWLNNSINSAAFTIYGNPAEARMSANEKTFISVRNDGITLSPGLGNQINIQGMSHNLAYGGMVVDISFPLSLIPSTVGSPIPKQTIKPPLMDLLPTIRELSAIASSFVGV